MDRQVTLEQVAQAAADTLKGSIYVCMPGAIVSYNAGAQLADVQPMVNDVRFDLETGAVVFEPWQVIKGVPVAWPRFGGIVFAGPLEQNDQVILQAFDLDPSPWRAQGRSTKPINPVDVRRLGGNYWRCIPSDLTGPMKDSAAMELAGIIGVDGDVAQIRFTPGKIMLGASAKQPVARAPDPTNPSSVGDTVNAGYLVLSNAGLPVSYFPGTMAGKQAAQQAAQGIMGSVLAMEQGSITSGSGLVLAG